MKNQKSQLEKEFNKSLYIATVLVILSLLASSLILLVSIRSLQESQEQHFNSDVENLITPPETDTIIVE